MALDEELRKQCLIELDRKRRAFIGKAVPEAGDLFNNIQETIKESADAIQHLVGLAPGGLKNDTGQELMRGRQELLEAISAMQEGLGQLNHELAQRKIEIID